LQTLTEQPSAGSAEKRPARECEIKTGECESAAPQARVGCADCDAVCWRFDGMIASTKKRLSGSAKLAARLSEPFATCDSGAFWTVQIASIGTTEGSADCADGRQREIFGVCNWHDPLGER